MHRLRLTCTAMNRPELFRDMLGSLLQCGTEGWHLDVAVEPGPQQTAFAPICEAMLPAGSFDLRVNPQRLGIRENPYQLIAACFDQGAPFVLALEEDLKLAPDALNLARWYHEAHRPHWTALNLLAGACGSAGLLSWPDEPALLFESRCFNSIGVGLTRADWTRLAPVWRTPTTPPQHGLRGLTTDWGWDWSVFGLLMRDTDLRVVQPVAARCTHLGTTGTHCTPAFQERAFARIELAHTPQPGPDGGYRLSAIDALPPRIAAHATSQQESATYLAGHLRSLRPKGPLALRLSRLNRSLRGRTG